MVFDGVGADRAFGALEVRHAEEADAVLERLAVERAAPRGVVLVSSDRLIRETAGQEVADGRRTTSQQSSRARHPRRARAFPRRSRRRRARPGHPLAARAVAPPAALDLPKAPCYLPFTFNLRVRVAGRTAPFPPPRGNSPCPRTQAAVRPAERIQREQDDVRLVVRARNGDQASLDALLRRYTGFVRLKASSYFIAGGESDDLIQEGLIGLYKAVRDFRADKDTSFRSFAELCITRQIITAIKAATRYKHQPLNGYVSFSQTPAGQDDGDCTLGDALPGPGVDDPAVCVISTEELQSLVFASAPVSRRSRRTPCASTWRATRTRRWPRCSAATRRRSTTPSSA